MKEHRTKALRVTTPHCLSLADNDGVNGSTKKDLIEVECDNANAEDDLFLQVLQVGIHTAAVCSASASSSGSCFASVAASSASAAASSASASSSSSSFGGHRHLFSKSNFPIPVCSAADFSADNNVGSLAESESSYPVTAAAEYSSDNSDNDDSCTANDTDRVSEEKEEEAGIGADVAPVELCRSCCQLTMTTDTATITANRTFSSTGGGTSRYHNHQVIAASSSTTVDKQGERPPCLSNPNSRSLSVKYAEDNHHTEESQCSSCFQMRMDDVGSGSSSESSSNTAKSATVLEIVSGNLLDSWLSKLQEIEEAIGREKSGPTTDEREVSNQTGEVWWDERDVYGNTALLVSGQKLLSHSEYEKAVQLTRLLLQEGSDVNATNDENRNLLSYSIQYMDNSIQLTIMLINYGTNIWPSTIDQSAVWPTMKRYCSLNNSSNSSSDNSRALNISSTDNDRNEANYPTCNYITCNYRVRSNSTTVCSAFTWFLRAVIRHRKLDDHCLKTLFVLSEAMGEEPGRMHSHVMSTMFGHARYYVILGPVFLQIKLAMSPYWTQPHSLKYLCRAAIRQSILRQSVSSSASSSTSDDAASSSFLTPSSHLTPSRRKSRYINEHSVSQLPLPRPLQSYIMFQS